MKIMNVVNFKLLMMIFECNLINYYLFYVVCGKFFNIELGFKCVSIFNNVSLWMILDFENIY